MSKKLTQRQKDAADYLAKGLNNAQTAKMIGCDRITISNWKKKPEFQHYLQELIELREIDRRTAAAQVAQKEEFDRHASINEWKMARIAANKAKLDCGSQILDKITARFHDLPQEAFAPSHLAAFFKLGNDMIESAFKGWGDAIELSGMKPSYTVEIEAIQKLVEAGLLPQSTLESLLVGLDEFQKQAIAALTAAQNPDSMDM